MDPLKKMREYAPLINLVHYKDWDGQPEFALMGQGKVDLDRHHAVAARPELLRLDRLRRRSRAGHRGSGWRHPARRPVDQGEAHSGIATSSLNHPLAMPTISTNGIQLYYEERGTGDPVLLIMGITAPGSVWELHAKFWQEQFRCILPDNRGVGLTDKPAGPYSSAMMADDFVGLLDALGLARVRVVGCSMGSIIAQQLALRHPQRVRSLVLMCPWARCDAYARGIFEHMKTIKARLARRSSRTTSSS